MNSTLPQFLPKVTFKRGLVFGFLIVMALIAFEMFNYSTTDYALADLLGELRFLGIRWATILAIAFCGIDFAGIARLFTPEQGANEPAEVWYLFGAWLLAATMNAMLTWWGVSIAILSHPLGNEVVSRDTLIKVVPIFVAIMVWIIRILIIGTFSVAGDHIFSQAERSSNNRRSNIRPVPKINPQTSALRSLNQPTFRPSPKNNSYIPQTNSYTRSEPSYHPISMSGHAPNEPGNQKRS